jgi:hypothetical protein
MSATPRSDIDTPAPGKTWWKVTALVRRETLVFERGWFAARAAGAAQLGALVENCNPRPHHGPLEVPSVPVDESFARRA